MAETPNLGLPLIDSNMTADVPRDVNALANAVDAAVGDMSSVPTDAKDAAGAISELFQSVSDGKALVAAAITDKGVSTAADDSFAEMASNIDAIQVGPDTSDATATAADILVTKTAYGASGTKITGAIPNRGAMTITPSTADQTIQVGYHNGSGKVVGDPDLISANIKAGANIFGVVGKSQVVDTTTTTGATPAQILSGREAFINGSKVTGGMPNRGGAHQLAKLADGSSVEQRLYLQPMDGWYDGSFSVYYDEPDFIASNIRKGANVFGLVGSLVEGRKMAAGTVQAPTPSGNYQINITGLTFSPKTVIISSRILFTDAYYLAAWTIESGAGISMNGGVFLGSSSSQGGRWSGNWAPNASGILITVPSWGDSSTSFIAFG